MSNSSVSFRMGRRLFGLSVVVVSLAVVAGTVPRMFPTPAAKASAPSITFGTGSIQFAPDGDADNNGIVNVGDTIQVSALITNTDADNSDPNETIVGADLTAFGCGGSVAMDVIDGTEGPGEEGWGGATCFVSSGSTDVGAGVQTVNINYADGDDAPTSSATGPLAVAFDNERPIISPADLDIDTSDCSGTDGTCIIGDTILFTWDALEEGNTDDFSDVSVDLTDFGGGVYVTMYDDHTHDDDNADDGIWTVSQTLGFGEGAVEASGLQIAITVIDNANNVHGSDWSVDTASMDNVAPAAPTINVVAAADSNDEINAAERADTVVVTGTNEALSTVTLDGNVASGDTLTTWSYILDAEAIDAFGQGPQTLTAVASDSAGNTAQVTRDINVDTVLPTLDASSPAEDARSVSRDADLVLTFSEPLAEEFTEGTQFNVTPDAGDWTAEADEDGVVTLSHSERLDCGTDYTVELDMATMSDAAGNDLDAEGSAVSNSYTFRTKGCGSSTPASSSTGSTTTDTEETVTDESTTTDETESTDATETETEAETTTDSQGRTWAPESSSSGSSPYDGSIQPISVVEDGQFIRGEHYSSVYYVGADQVRHPFWDAQSFFTYADSWSDVTWVTDATLATMELGTPMLPKAGVVLVKIQSDPKVYAVESGSDGASNLRWVPSEEVATTLYGSTWADYVIDVEPTTMHWYGEGDDMTSATTVDRTIMKTRMAIAMLAMGM